MTKHILTRHLCFKRFRQKRLSRLFPPLGPLRVLGTSSLGRPIQAGRFPLASGLTCFIWGPGYTFTNYNFPNSIVYVFFFTYNIHLFSLFALGSGHMSPLLPKYISSSVSVQISAYCLQYLASSLVFHSSSFGSFSCYSWNRYLYVSIYFISLLHQLFLCASGGRTVEKPPYLSKKPRTRSLQCSL